MKKFLLIFIILLGFNIFKCQENVSHDKNIFQQSEENTQSQNGPDFQAEGDPNGPPLDNDIPIDNYLPVLVFMASSLIVYNSRRKNTIIKKRY